MEQMHRRLEPVLEAADSVMDELSGGYFDCLKQMEVAAPGGGYIRPRQFACGKRCRPPSRPSNRSSAGCLELHAALCCLALAAVLLDPGAIDEALSKQRPSEVPCRECLHELGCPTQQCRAWSGMQD